MILFHFAGPSSILHFLTYHSAVGLFSKYLKKYYFLNTKTELIFYNFVFFVVVVFCPSCIISVKNEKSEMILLEIGKSIILKYISKLGQHPIRKIGVVHISVFPHI